MRSMSLLPVDLPYDPFKGLNPQILACVVFTSTQDFDEVRLSRYGANLGDWGLRGEFLSCDMNRHIVTFIHVQIMIAGHATQVSKPFRSR